MGKREKIILILIVGLFVTLFGQRIAVAATCGFGTDIGGGVCRGYLTSGTSWTVPSDWNNSNNTIEVIGGGGGGSGGVDNTSYNHGGGGGGYSKASNVILQPGTSVRYAVGGGGQGGKDARPGGNGGDTFLCDGLANCTSINGGAVKVGAKGGQGGLNTTGGAGGSSADGVGSIRRSGGKGGTVLINNNQAAGGGGAGGPYGHGAKGGDASDQRHGGTGGGGSGGGSDGSVNRGDKGGHGGNNAQGVGGGRGGGTAGSPGVKGGGGGGGDTGDNAGAGGPGEEWGNRGAGGGGGGSGAGAHGGAGGLYGGGGGGARGIYRYVWNPDDTVTRHTNGGQAGNGAQGIIVITYTPQPPAPSVTFTCDDATGTNKTSCSYSQGGPAVTLRWSSSYATSCVGTNFSTGGSLSGSRQVTVTTQTQFRVECSGQGGTRSRNVDVAYTPTPNTPPSPPALTTAPSSPQAGVSYTYGFTSDDPNNDKLYYEVDWDNNGIANERIPAGASLLLDDNTEGRTTKATSTPGVFRFAARAIDQHGAPSNWRTHTVPMSDPTPSLVFTCDDESGTNKTDCSYRQGGPAVTLRWSSSYATSCVGTNFNTNGAPSGERAVTVIAQTRFTVECTGESGTRRRNVDVAFVANNPPEQPQIQGSTQGFIGTAFSFSTQTTDPDGDTVRYNISWTGSGNTQPDRAIPQGGYTTGGVWRPFQQSWDQIGEKTLTVTATDRHGAMSPPATLTVNIQEDEPPPPRPACRSAWGRSGCLQALPPLVQTNSQTTLYWNIEDAVSCEVRQGTEVIHTETSAGEDGLPSNPIPSRTTFTLDCEGEEGAPAFEQQSVVVDIVPSFIER